MNPLNENEVLKLRRNIYFDNSKTEVPHGDLDGGHMTYDMNDPIDHPAHYTQYGSGGVQCIDAIRALTQHLTDPYEAYLAGTILKYLWRFEDKNGLQDLLKAEAYLVWLIDRERELEESGDE